MTDPIGAFIQQMTEQVVDTPSSVHVVTLNSTAESTTYLVRVAPSELGQAVGKEGRIAMSIRTLAKAAAMKSRRKVYVDVVRHDEDEGEEP